jgi:Domain of unknown function (DUF6867)
MDISIPHLIYEEDSFGVFVLVTVFLGGGAAWLTGRAIAGTWRPWWQVPVYMLILGVAVRFFHYALFDGTFVSPYYYTVDTLICLLFGFLGFRLTRVQQMVTQYAWINARRGLFGWARRAATPAVNERNSG